MENHTDWMLSTIATLYSIESSENQKALKHIAHCIKRDIPITYPNLQITQMRQKLHKLFLMYFT